MSRVVEYESILGKPVNLKPMTLVDLVERGLGSKVYVWYAEEDNPLRVRMNGVYKVVQATSLGDTKPLKLGELRVPCTLILSPGGLPVHIMADNPDMCRASLRGYRGRVYLYHPPQED